MNEQLTSFIEHIGFNRPKVNNLDQQHWDSNWRTWQVATARAQAQEAGDASAAETSVASRTTLFGIVLPESTPADEMQALRDMLGDARGDLETLREALGVSVEPHQSLFERMLEAARGKAVRGTAKQLYDAIEQVLLHYQMSNLQDEHGGGFRLVDHLCKPDNHTIESGQHEIRLIVDEIYNEVLTKVATNTGEAKLATDTPRKALAKSVFGGINALRWLLNVTTEFDRKDVRTRQAARLLDEYSNGGATNRQHLEHLWRVLNDELSTADVLDCLGQDAPVDWRHVCDTLIDIYDDGTKNPPESRCYVEGAWRDELQRVRDALAATKPSQGEARCKACHGNNGDLPCAYPKGHAQCLRNEHPGGTVRTGAVHRLKDHEVAAAVNGLRDIAFEFHGTQQLRERIARFIVPLLKGESLAPAEG